MSAPVSILGLGASGVAAARLALSKGETVYVSDLRTDARAAADAHALRELGARVDLGSHDLGEIAASRVVVVSPGIPPGAPVLRELRDRGVRWVSEPDFAVRFFQGPLIAVTGTNGKTTTAALIAHCLHAAGVDAALGGNVGGGIAPAASELALRDHPPAWYVLEMSSFQLADVEVFAPRIGVVTNLAPDHLDRYPDLVAYYGDKARLFHLAAPDDLWVLNGEDTAVLALPGDAPGLRLTFGWEDGKNAAFLRGDTLTLQIPAGVGAAADTDGDGDTGGEEEPLVTVSELSLLGRHNVMNALAAALAARLAGAGVTGIREGLRTFRPLPHRMEPVGEVGGVLWVNDSKATNVGAAVTALESLDRPVVAILGGKDKGEGYAPLVPILRTRARAAVLYGEAGARMEEELAGAGIPILRERDFADAVTAGAGAALEGDLLLLAPACSSYDQFENYEARGRAFMALAREGGGGVP